jgi:hypothetical protein
MVVCTTSIHTQFPSIHTVMYWYTYWWNICHFFKYCQGRSTRKKSLTRRRHSFEWLKKCWRKRSWRKKIPSAPGSVRRGNHTPKFYFRAKTITIQFRNFTFMERQLQFQFQFNPKILLSGNDYYNYNSIPKLYFQATTITITIQFRKFTFVPLQLILLL